MELIMRKVLLSAVFATASIMLTVPAGAHPEGEYDSINRGPTTSELAREAVDKLVSQKKLPASWSGALVTKFDVKTIGGLDRYIVTFENSAAKEATKRRLFVIMSTAGDFISAGFKPV
jgi:hypothetical protein